MSKSDEVSRFLADFKAKFKIWGVVFRDDRSKNSQALLDLEISPIYREKILLDLSESDYCEGPNSEKLYGGVDLWVFGREIKGNAVYIKISLGAAGNQVICISFHLAEFPLKFPLKAKI